MDNLKQLSEQIAEITYAEKKLAGRSSELRSLLEKKDKALLQLEKENKDVEKIAGVSFQSFVATLFNNRQEKLEKEELEAIEAKRVYDAIVYELENLQSEVTTLKAQISKKGDLEKAYQNALEIKKQEIYSRNPELWVSLEAFETKKKVIKAEIKELHEAINASNAVKSKARYALSELKDAKNLGVWDMMGGGMLVTMAKRDHMAKAQSIINELNYSLKTLSKELSDVNMRMTANLDIANYMSFADYFFDGFFMDMMVQDKINDALDKVNGLSNHVDDISSKLKTQLRTQEAAIEKLESELDEQIVNA